MSADKGELIELPNGSRLFYRDEDHSYWMCKPDGERGKRLTSVSTVVKPLDFNPDGLLRWVERLTLDGVSRGFADEEVPSDPHVLRTRLYNLGLDWASIRDDAADRGNNVHEQMLHALATGDEIPDLDDLPPDQRGYGQAVMAWWLDHDPTPLQAEQIVLSESLGVAGRFDLRCEIQGATWLIDLKTSRYVSAKMHAQLRGYDVLARECGIGGSENLLIVQAREDGTYVPIDCCADEEDFLAAVRVYRSSGRINSTAGKQRKQREALAQAA